MNHPRADGPSVPPHVSVKSHYTINFLDRMRGGEKIKAAERSNNTTKEELIIYRHHLNAFTHNTINPVFISWLM